MNGFTILAPGDTRLRFEFYNQDAPETASAFLKQLPFSRIFFHARVSGLEIWCADAPTLNVPQENSTVFASPGEIVIGPASPVRNKVAGLMGIFYGEGKLVDGGNIFGRIIAEDLSLLQKVGDEIWRNGSRELVFEL